MLDRSYLVALAVVAACQIPDGTFTKVAEDAAPPPPPSCVGLPATCGASGTDSCCNSPTVPGGSYDRSYDVAGGGDINSPATVSNFGLDKYLVTVGRFRAFVEAGMGTQASPPQPGAGGHASIAGSGWNASWSAILVADKPALIAAVKCDPNDQTWTDTPAANEHRPMNCITWYEALAFCAWDGGYLATEAEWNYAAAGGDQQRPYPWSVLGNLLTIDSSHASYSCGGDGISGCALTDLVAVGSKPAGDGRWGQSDLAGNVWEWTLDWYAAYVNPCVDCANLTTGTNRMVRGGSFGNDPSYLRTGARSYFNPALRYYYVGVRCARSVP